MSLFRTEISTHLTDGPVDAMARETFPGMAHFAGTGPDGQTCGACKHRGYYRESRKGSWDERLNQIVYRTYRTMKCAMFKRLTGNHGADIDKDSKACKYFQARK